MAPESHASFDSASPISASSLLLSVVRMRLNLPNSGMMFGCPLPLCWLTMLTLNAEAVLESSRVLTGGAVVESSRVSGYVLELVWMVIRAEDLRLCHRRYLLVQDCLLLTSEFPDVLLREVMHQDRCRGEGESERC